MCFAVYLRSVRGSPCLGSKSSAWVVADHGRTLGREDNQDNFRDEKSTVRQKRLKGDISYGLAEYSAVRQSGVFLHNVCQKYEDNVASHQIINHP